MNLKPISAALIAAMLTTPAMATTALGWRNPSPPTTDQDETQDLMECVDAQTELGAMIVGLGTCDASELGWAEHPKFKETKAKVEACVKVLPHDQILPLSLKGVELAHNLIEAQGQEKGCDSIYRIIWLGEKP